MLVRRAAVAIGLSAVLIGAGAGSAVAATEGAAPGEDSSGLLGGLEDTVSSLTGKMGLSDQGEEAGKAPAGQDQQDTQSDEAHAQRDRQPAQQDGGGEQPAGEDTRGHEGGDGAGRDTGSDASGSGLGGSLPELGGNLPELGGEEGSLPGVCAGADLDGDAPCPDTELLGGSPLELCFDEAQLGADFAEQLGVTCLEEEGEDEGEKPPAPSEPPKDDGGGKKDHDPTVMPPPRHRAPPAEPAEPVSAQPSFTG